MEEDEKYDPAPKEPVMPETKPLAEVVSAGEVDGYEPAVFWNEAQEAEGEAVNHQENAVYQVER